MKDDEIDKLIERLTKGDAGALEEAVELQSKVLREHPSESLKELYAKRKAGIKAKLTDDYHLAYLEDFRYGGPESPEKVSFPAGRGNFTMRIPQSVTLPVREKNDGHVFRMSFSGESPFEWIYVEHIHALNTGLREGEEEMEDRVGFPLQIWDILPIHPACAAWGAGEDIPIRDLIGINRSMVDAAYMKRRGLDKMASWVATVRRENVVCRIFILVFQRGNQGWMVEYAFPARVSEKKQIASGMTMWSDRLPTEAEAKQMTNEFSHADCEKAQLVLGSFTPNDNEAKEDRGERLIGGFRILQKVHRDSKSRWTVFKAECVEDKYGIVPVGTIVALKVSPSTRADDTKERWTELETRTKALIQLQHPNVIRYHGCFVESGGFKDLHVLVLEFLNGKTLKQHLAEDFPSGLDVDVGLWLIHSALVGLNYMAQAGIIHRDIKPGNIFICNDGTVKLIDFEIARQEGGTSVSVSGNIRGSFDYMAPDFTDPEFHGDVQSDIFSLGVVMHEVLTGKTPYQRLPGEEKQANFAFLSRWAQTGDGQIVNPIQISRSIKRLLAHADEVLLRALAPRREERYPDFASFEADFGMIRFRDLKHGSNTYRLLQWIGKGGCGEVFKARFRETGQLVAIKHLLRADYADRFNREARTLIKLRDSCFVQFVDFFQIKIGKMGPHEMFLVMEYLDGMPGNSLRDAIRRSRTGLPWADVFAAFKRYAHGLSLMHSQGVIHRGIKPSDLYYPKGNPEGAVIMDFSILRDVNGTQTDEGGCPGTFDYMPPEVILTNSRGDSRMDIFALGLCLYESLTGKTGYPRLPTGSAVLRAFCERAKSGKQPVFDDPKVQGNRKLILLLRDMTNIDPQKRISDVSEVERRIDEIMHGDNRIPIKDLEPQCLYACPQYYVKPKNDAVKVLYGCPPYERKGLQKGWNELQIFKESPRMRRNTRIGCLLLIAAPFLFWLAWRLGQIL